MTDDFANRLIARRRALGLSQAEAAKRAEAGVRNYQRWEAGETLPHLRQLPAIAKALQTTGAELLGESPVPTDVPRSAHELALDARLARIEAALAALTEAPSSTPEVLRQADELTEQELAAQDTRQAAS